MGLSLMKIYVSILKTYPNYKEKDIDFTFLQTNHEGEIVDYLHKAYTEKYDGIVLNAGGYTHTSVLYMMQ